MDGARGMTEKRTGFTHEPSNSTEFEWYTPPEVFTAMGLRFDLDPCAPPGGVPWIPADKYYTETDDGLSQPWFGRVWLNPPYGKQTGQWLRMLAEHGNGVALVFSRTDPVWFHETAVNASLICFTRGRIRFVRSDGRPSGTGGSGSMFLAYGEENASYLYASGLGACVRPIGDGKR